MFDDDLGHCVSWYVGVLQAVPMQGNYDYWSFCQVSQHRFADVLNSKSMAEPEISNFECQPYCHTARCSTGKVPEVSQQLQKMSL